MVPARTLKLAGLGVAAVLLMPACRKPEPATSPASTGTPAASTAPAADFDAVQAAWRKQRLEELTAPDGFLTLLTRTWMDDGTHTVGRAADNTIRIEHGPAHLATVVRKGTEVTLTPAKGAVLTVDGKPLTGPITMRDATPTQPGTRVAFDKGEGSLAIIVREDKIGLRVRHAQAPTRTGFAGLQYFDADPRWRVQARFVPHPAGKTLPIVNVLGQTTPTPNPGALEFSIDGKPYRLEALDDGVPGQLFVVFGDRSNGHGSYGGGRFIQPASADAQGNVTLDFNQAFSPPCAFTPFATCPLPPPENRLDLKIEAGERAPPTHP